ncbi:unnamed protein product [Parnassius mnemosyne]|uniref:TRAF3-interacting protein 1 n=1 Tax=Parnassius mnemosyne TaxID=213953 RepID=A0AAV1KMA6_9NEOP
MEEELDSAVIRATQLSLGKFVKKPPLTEKLLKKPPFRFLHDIITNVLSTTGFFEGLFEEEELISDNVKDRESKIHFLNKVITVLGLITGKSLKAKPSKIIAGQEPANTNELLQCLGEALEKKLSSQEAVKKYNETTKITVSNDKKNKDAVKGLKKNNDTKKVSSKGSDKIANTEKDSKTISKSRQRDNSITKKDSPPKKSQSTTNVRKNRVKSPKEQKTSLLNEKKKQEKLNNINQSEEHIKSAEKKSSEGDPQTNKSHESVVNVIQNEKETLFQDSEKAQTDFEDNNVSKYKSETTVSKNTEEDQTIHLKHDDDVNNQKELDIVTVKEESNKIIIEETKTLLSDTKHEENNEMENHKSESRMISLDSNVVNMYEKRAQNVRPSSSRPGAPRVKDKYDAALIGNENPIVHKVNIIEENTVPEEEEDGSIIILDNQAGSFSTSQNEEQMQLSSNQHGHLVQQILDSQKEFSQISGKTEIEWQFGAQKARDVINQEIEQIRFNVQALSRVSNPLGKLIDHVQEDVEVMRQELQEWIKKYEETSKELTKQKVANTESLQPLQAKIKQLDAEIEEKREKINDLRIVVFKNFYRIEKLLSSGSVQ